MDFLKFLVSALLSTRPPPVRSPAYWHASQTRAFASIRQAAPRAFRVSNRSPTCARYPELSQQPPTRCQRRFTRPPGRPSSIENYTPSDAFPPVSGSIGKVSLGRSVVRSFDRWIGRFASIMLPNAASSFTPRALPSIAPPVPIPLPLPRSTEIRRPSIAVYRPLAWFSSSELG